MRWSWSPSPTSTRIGGDTVTADLPAAVPRYADLEPILAAEGIAAVVLATPPRVTTGLTARALAAGKYVLAEKPIATAVAVVRPLAALPAEHLDRLQVGLTYRHDPALVQLRELIRHGPLHGPKLIRAHIYDERLDPANFEHTTRLRRVVDHGPRSCTRARTSSTG